MIHSLHYIQKVAYTLHLRQLKIPF